MNITEVRVKRLKDRSDRLRAFCSITIDDEFVVHDMRVIEGRKGLFVAMPSRKLTDNCPSCGGKNHLRARYCNDCGGELESERGGKPDKYHVDVAHPIVTSCRDKIKDEVLGAYRQQCGKDGDEEVDSRREEGDGNMNESELSESETSYETDEDFVSEESGQREEKESEEAPEDPGADPAGVSPEALDSTADEEEKQEESEDRREEGGFGEGIF